jgi:hypothetical protein
MVFHAPRCSSFQQILKRHHVSEKVGKKRTREISPSFPSMICSAGLRGIDMLGICILVGICGWDGIGGIVAGISQGFDV